MDDEPVAPVTPQRQFQTRAYQQELLHESLRRNIVIALDTGSGKTHIAVLRMKHEVERDTKKVYNTPIVLLIILIGVECLVYRPHGGTG